MSPNSSTYNVVDELPANSELCSKSCGRLATCVTFPDLTDLLVVKLGERGPRPAMSGQRTFVYRFHQMASLASGYTLRQLDCSTVSGPTPDSMGDLEMRIYVINL